MKVLKFGGTSVGSAERMKEVANLINTNDPKVVVLSAMSGTTNALVEISDRLYKKKNEEAIELIKSLEKRYYTVVKDLYKTKECMDKGNGLIREHFAYIMGFTQDVFTLFEERAILAQGELISTALFHYYLSENGINSILLPALDFMRINQDEEPDISFIKEHASKEIAKYPGQKLFITQGYICRNPYGEIDNLKRGGSDYTATLLGAALDATEIQIWTDIDGVHNNDPRVVDKTYPITQLSFDEAAELAYFGAKILHPSCVLPAKEENVPVWLKNTMEPSAHGTKISDEETGGGIKAIAAKDGITAIKIKSGRMLLAYGFLRKVFEIFESHKTPIDMITTSEVAVSLTIDDSSSLDEIVKDIQKFGSVEVDENQTIICIVGDFIVGNKGYALQVLQALKDVPIRMISYGGSRHNISVLIDTNDKKKALQALNDSLFTKLKVEVLK